MGPQLISAHVDRILKAVFGLLLITVAACAPMDSPATVASYRQGLNTGNFVAAAAVARPMARPDAAGRPTELQWALNTGISLFHAGDYPGAIEMFDAAEAMMSARDTQATNLGRVYRYGAYDAVLVNTYKAMAMLASNNPDGARVEFNRLDERQQRTAQQFEAEIAANTAQAERQFAENSSRQQAFKTAFETPDAQSQTAQLQQWAVYAPFQNPAATYLHGLYRLTSGVPSDREQAVNYMRRTAGMTGNNSVVAADLAMAQTAARGGRVPNLVWVLFENGQSPIFEQLNITFPAPVIGAGMSVTVRPITVSVPRMVVQPSAYGSIDVAAGSVRAPTQMVASIEGIMASEFRQRWPGHVRDAVLEGVAKMVGVSAANAAASAAARQVGGFGGLAIMIASEAATLAAANTTSSDIRSWYGLPREFQVARVPLPADRRLTVSVPGGPGETVEVPAGRSSIVLVKAQAPGSPLRVQVLPLGGG